MSYSPGVTKNKSAEVFQENVRLKNTVHELKKLDGADSIISEQMSIEDPIEYKKSKMPESLDRFRRYVVRHGIIWIFLALLLTICAVYLLITHYTTGMIRLQKALSITKPTKASPTDPCRAGVTKKTFPDLDYAMFGYNIIRAYPLATGRDPGLTRPVFQADYTSNRLSGDCIYQLPKGFTVVPDVSCVTSFSSETIKDSKELKDSLSISAEVSGSGWGASFSASASYKKSSEEMSSSEKYIINSEAKCDYYVSKLDEMQPPNLTKSFIKKVKTLKTDMDLFGFFEYYGTHFLKEVVFGARFTFVNTIKKSDYSKVSNEDISVEVQASYSGAATISGKFSTSKSKSSAVKKFQEKVETKTISVGAPPPASQKAADWAASVKDTPVPTRYKLVSIEELFTKRYMANIGVDYAKLNKQLKAAKEKYCQHLKRKGVVDSCKPPETYVRFDRITLGAVNYATRPIDYISCVRTCTEEKRCVAMTHNGAGGSMCWLYDGKRQIKVEFGKPKDVAVLMITRIGHLFSNLTMTDVHVSAVKRGIHENVERNVCRNKCKADSKCIAIAYRSDYHNIKCFLYKKSSFVRNSIQFKGKRQGYTLEFINDKTIA